MRLKAWHCWCLLALVVLVVYYPTIHAGYNSIDDLKMVGRMENAGQIDFLHHFFPNNKHYYYRPLTTLSYLFDRNAWGAIASFMHLENILLHLGCTLLVFAIARRLYRVYPIIGEHAPIFSALFFALHPLATESICWISGRTDPLAGFFLLLTVWLNFIAVQERRFLIALISGLPLFLACLAKEVAVFILPGMLWFIAVFPETGVSWMQRLRRRCIFMVPSGAAIAAYFVVRHIAIVRDTGVKAAIQGVSAGDFSLLDKVRVALKVYGFYFKKLFVPWPLNFGIVEISGWYVLSGIVLAVLLLYMVWRADVLGALGLMAFSVLSPALLVVFGKMTWTPVAERYLYTSTALFAPLATYLLLQLRAFITDAKRYRFDTALAALLLVLFGTTMHRAWIWQDNLRLYQDTVAKSPNFAAAKTELASALMHKGRVAEAEALLEGMQDRDSATSFVNDKLNLACVLFGKGNLDGAREVLIPLLERNHKKHYDVLQLLIRVNDLRLGKAANRSARTAIHQESLGWLMEEQRIRPQAFTLYRIGKRHLAMGNEEQALVYFKKAYAQADKDAHYRGAAATFIRRLEGI